MQEVDDVKVWMKVNGSHKVGQVKRILGLCR
jgi:hypothetical protein